MTSQHDQTPPEVSFAIGPLAEIAREVQRKKVGALADQGAQLRSAIATVQEAIELRRRAGDDLLTPLQQHADAAHTIWLRACAALEAQKLQNESALVPLRNRLEELTRALNAPAPGFGANTRQWQVPSWAADQPTREQMARETEEAQAQASRRRGPRRLY